MCCRWIFAAPAFTQLQSLPQIVHVSVSCLGAKFGEFESVSSVCWSLLGHEVSSCFGMGQLTAEQRATIAYLHKTGMSVTQIQREVGYAQATVSRWVKASEEGRGPVRKRRNVRTLIFDHATAVRAAQLLKGQEEGGSKYVARQLFKEGRVVRVPSRQTVTRAAKKASKETGDPGGEGIFSSVGKRSWVLQQDKDPTHGAATAMVDKHNRLRIHSPDLSPIENVWAIVGAKVDKLGCKTFAQFKKAVNRTFQNLPKATLVNLLDSVPKRMRLCLEKDGGRLRH